MINFVICRFSRLRNTESPLLTCVSAEQEMALTNIFTRLSSFKLGLINLTQVFLRKLTFVASLIVDLSPTKVIMRDSITRDSILLGQYLRLPSL